MELFYSTIYKNATIGTMNAGNPVVIENIPPSTCFRCGECCAKYQALVGDDEIQQIADYLGISPEKLKRDFTDPRWPIRGKFLLRHHGDTGCIFIAQHRNIRLCSIHAVKPHPCRDWTPSLSHKECRQGLRNVWGLTVNDEGEICGTESTIIAFAEHLRSISS